MFLVAIAVCLIILLAEQVRVMRMPKEKRVLLLERRSLGVMSPARDARTYRRRLTVGACVATVVGACVVVLSATSASKDRGRNVLATAGIVVLVLATFAVLGLLNLKRVRDDSNSN